MSTGPSGESLSIVLPLITFTTIGLLANELVGASNLNCPFSSVSTLGSSESSSPFLFISKNTVALRRYPSTASPTTVF